MSLGGSKQPSTTTQTQVSTPWAGQQPYLSDLFARAQANLNQPPQYFPGSTVAPQSNATQKAIDMAQGTATNLQGAPGQGLNLALYNMGAGRDVGNDPYLQSAISAAMQPVIQDFGTAGGPLSAIRSHFQSANSGGTGTREGIAQGLAYRSLGQQLTNMSQSMTENAYQGAQQRAVQSLALMPQTLQSQAYPSELMAAAGTTQDDYAQALLQDQINRWNFQQTLPAQQLAQYQNLVTGNFGGTSTGTSTAPGTQRSPLLGALGGAATGAALSSMLPAALGVTGPIGMGIGALIGLLG